MPSSTRSFGNGIRGVIVSLSVSGNDDVVLGDIGSAHAGSWIIHYVPGVGSPAGFTPKTRVRGSGLSGTDLSTTVYYDAQGNTITAGTASTTAKVYVVPSDGVDVVLSITAAANGGTAYCVPVVGA